MPEVEAELSRLDRDYEVNKRQYDTLLERLESAKISEQAEQSSENVKFRVIEPPTVPLKPSGPNRILLNSMVLLLALGSGAYTLDAAPPMRHRPMADLPQWRWPQPRPDQS